MTKYYQILEINENSKAEQIKPSYRKLAQKWHPDKWANKTIEERLKATEKMQEINEAYEVLGDEEKRKQYDLGATNFSSETSRNFYEDIGERLRREEESLKEEIGDKKERIRKIGEFLLRSDSIHEIYYELAMNNIYSVDLDSSLWAPYGTFGEKIFSIEIGDDENDLDFIDRRKVLAFKEQMVEAIRKRGIEIKNGINVPKVDNAREKGIQEIERCLNNKGVKAEDLGEYSSYREKIGSLVKVWKINSFVDEVIEKISSVSRQKTKLQGNGDVKNDDFKNARDFNSSNQEQKSPYSSYFDEKKFNDFSDSNRNQYENLTKKELILKINQLEAKIKTLEEEIRELKGEEQTLEIKQEIQKREKNLQNLKSKLSGISHNEKEKNKFSNLFNFNHLLLGGTAIIILLVVGLIIYNLKKNRMKKFW
jgi:curved DNA-binding protein CbpA